jgi:PAS domain S-box-containing protein
MRLTEERRSPTIQSAEKRAIDDAALRLAAIVESSDDAIVGKDLNGVVTNWNKAAERIFGYTAEEMIGRSITTIIPEDLQGDEPIILSKIRSGQRIEHFETERVRKDGRRIHVSLTVSPIRTEDGTIIGAAKIARDITHQKLSEHAADRLAAIVESSDDAIVGKDLTGIVTNWNKAAERIFGYKAEEIIGKPITTIIPIELQGDEPGILARIQAGERIEHFETVRVTKDGRRLHVSLTVSPIKDSKGKIVGAAKIARDITQQKKLEDALRTTERLASVGRLAATVAHEINNPLEAVTNFIYLANQQPELSEKLKRYLSSADQELRRVAHIAQQTLGFYKDNSHPAIVRIADAVRDVLTVYERKVSYKQLCVEQRVAPELKILTLAGELKQVLSNLIANAIDASREGGRIVIRARAANNNATGSSGIYITIADTGVGIAARDQAHLFTPFFTTKKEVGTGLGLWITRDLLQKKGGNIRFRSRDHKSSGTVMRIYLPAEAATQTVNNVA